MKKGLYTIMAFTMLYNGGYDAVQATCKLPVLALFPALLSHPESMRSHVERELLVLRLCYFFGHCSYTEPAKGDN